jgi:hypothetical protein
MDHPYSDLAERQVWRRAVAEKAPFEVSGLWQPKFAINRRTRIVTAGSCFAQHIGRALKARGYRWIDAEPAPEGASAALARRFGYGMFSFRTGNIYTPAMLDQWLGWAFAGGDAGGDAAPDIWWQQDGRWYDPFRPAVEPDGFASREEARASRAACLAAIRDAVDQAGVFVFTLGLTEAWRDRASGVEFAVCPGTVAGRFDAAAHAFVNHTARTTRAAMTAALRRLRARNRRIRVLLTVSPVPLTATATPRHVLTATSHSKAVLRTVAGELAEAHGFVDYFPSYEIITSPVFRGMFYGPNQRTVVPAGVDFVMRSFFADQAAAFGGAAAADPDGAADGTDTPAAPDAPGADDIQCEEAMLDAFGR